MFYDNYVALCAKLGKSPSGVAREIGLSNAAANGWKNGKKPNDTTLAKLSEYFGVSISELAEGKKEKAPALEGRRESDIRQAKIALFGGDGEVTDEMWEEAIFAAQLIKERHKRKKE